MDLVGAQTSDDRLIQIGYDDLLAFRDGSQVAQGLGDHLFRALFPVLTEAETVSRLYSKPRGFPEDHETELAILQDEPGGDGLLGPLVDAWFLARPFCRSRRAGITAISSALAALPRAGGHAVAALGSGAAAEVRTLAASGSADGFRITCVDIDRAALVAASSTLAFPETASLTLVEANVVRVARGEERVALPPQRLIWAHGLLDHLVDGDVVDLLRWAGQRLAADGRLVVTQIHAPADERAVLEHLLELPLHHRDEIEVADLVVAAGWSRGDVSVDDDGTGAGLIASAGALT
jgi:hypothetical protein